MSKIQTVIALALVLTACGSNDSVTPDTTSSIETTGGSASTLTTSSTQMVGSTGGSSSKATGGSSANVAGTSSVLGTSETGGNQPLATGGSAPQGTTSTLTVVTGGNSGTGGSAPKATGGSSTTPSSTGGSSPGTGGSKATGGSNPGTGGSNPGTGGSKATGGSSSGTDGSTPKATGGSPSTGGSSTVTTTGGSNSGTGGSPSTGGSSTTATGGSAPQATGGTPSTGGSSAVTPPVPTQVSVGDGHTCTLMSDGHIKCWGDNTYGQLGNGNTTASPSPILVAGISNATQISSGYGYTCALITDGTVECWGNGGLGQLGNGVATIYTTGTNPPNPTPVQMLGVTSALQVSTGRSTTCVLLGDHTVKCVGFGGYGELGNGVQANVQYHSTTLVQVIGVTNATAVFSGSNYSCALLSDNTVKCWGQPGNGEFMTDYQSKTTTPVQLPNASNVVQLSVGDTNICYLEDTNQAFCIGSASLNPTTGVTFGSDPYILLMSSISVGSVHACAIYNRPALTTDSVVFCLGSNDSGQLGDGTTTASTGVVVPGITDATGISVRSSTSCAIQRSGTMKCWGNLTGNSSSPTSSVPVTPDGL